MGALLFLLTAQVLTGKPDWTSPEIRQAAARVEPLLGRRLLFYEGLPLGPGLSAMSPVFPEKYEAAEALITQDAIYVSSAQMAALGNATALAEFLSHAAAHARLNHPQRMQQVAREVMILNSTHAPEWIAQELLVRTRKEMEEAATAEAGEFGASANCLPDGCGAFARLLEALRLE